MAVNKPTSFIQPPGTGLRGPRSFSAPVRRSGQPQVPSPPKLAADSNNQDNAVEDGKRPSLALRIQIPPSPVAHVGYAPPTDDTESDNIRVVLRIRPMFADAANAPRRCLEVAPDRKGVTLAPASLQEKRFGFDQVFPENCVQENLFDAVGVTAVENALKGYNGSIFAYGQTGSGKTFTMLGGSGLGNVRELRQSPERGLMPRIFDYLFQRLSHLVTEKGPDALQVAVSCSYLEIYNEKIFDLLEESGSAAAQQPKHLREDSKRKEVYVDQLRDEPIESEEAAIEWLRLGSRNRHMASTDMNRESSRSHAVFTVKLVQTERTTAGVMLTRRSNLHLIDLAGSEKQRQTHVEGQRLKEAAQINKSLSALGNVIMSLVDVANGQKRHVHYRDSKLTFLLRDSLGGNAITSIIATISAEEKYFTETLSTLKFAQRAKFIKNNAVQNEDADSMVPILKLEIERLRQEIEELRSNPSSSFSQSVPSSPQGFFSAPQAQQPVDSPPKKNRWEPALDVMQKLLLASDAIGPADLEDGEQGNIESVEVRCERLEMLLYRMVCRLEEYKEITFAPQRSTRNSASQPSGLRAPRASMIQAPRKYGTLRHQDQASDNQVDKAASQHAEEMEKMNEQLKETTGKVDELEAENNLLRQELCELLEWRNRISKESSLYDRGLGEPSQPAAAVLAFAAPEPDEEMLSLVNTYRSLYEDVRALVENKKPILRAPPSPGSGSSVTEDTASVSYASDDESEYRESVDGDSNEGLNQDEADNDREVRRIHGLAKKLERKVDQFQDEIQRLERILQATRDELDTSSDTAKFVEFTLRNRVAEEALKLAETERKLELSLASNAQATGDYQHRVKELEMAKSDTEAKLLAIEEQLRKALDENQELNIKCASSVSELEEKLTLQDEEVKRLQELKASADAVVLKRDQDCAQYELELQDLRREHAKFEELKEAADADLSEARQRIQELEESAAASLPISGKSDVGSNGAHDSSTVDNDEVRGDDLSSSASRDCVVQPELQNLLDAALVDNAQLLATIRDLQVKQLKGGSQLEMSFSPIDACCSQTNQTSQPVQNASREKQLEDTVTALQEEVERLQKAAVDKKMAGDDPQVKVSSRCADRSQSADGGRNLFVKRQRHNSCSRLIMPRFVLVLMAVVVCGVLSTCWWQQNDEIKRLAGERVALSSRLQQTEQKMRRLEEELTRSRSSSATSALTPEFFCGY